MKRFITLLLCTLLALPAAAVAQTRITYGSTVPLKKPANEVQPDEDFYLYVNHATIARHPAGEKAWTQYHQLQLDVDESEKALIRQLQKNGSAAYASGTPERRLALMLEQMADDQGRNALGITPIQPYLDQIDACRSAGELLICIGRLTRQTGMTAFVYSNSMREESTNALYATLEPMPFGLSVVTDDPTPYEDEFVRLSLLLYESAGFADMREETLRDALELTRQLMAGGEYDPEQEQNQLLTPLTTIRQDMDGLDVAEYLAEVGYRGLDQVLMENTQYFRNMGALFPKAGIDVLKLICKHEMLVQAGLYLCDEVQTAVRRLMGLNNRVLYEEINPDQPYTGEDLPPVPYQGLDEDELLMYVGHGAVTQDLSIAFSRANTPAGAEEEVLAMTESLLKVFEIRIQALPWMSNATRVNALEKLNSITLNLIAPTHWRHAEEADSLCATMLSISASVTEEKTGQVNDRASYLSTWQMSADTVNACYDPKNNSINIPAAILRWPFYEAGDAVRNMGGLGAVVGHELTHAFDPYGSRYDSQGLLNNWWTEEDHDAYEAHIQQVEQYYGNYAYRVGEVQDTRSIIGECVADLGGLSIALECLNGSEADVQNALVSFGQLWAQAATDEQMDEAARMDAHPLKHVRTNAAVSAMEEFYTAFQVEKDDPMYVAEEDRPRVW